MSGFPNLSNIDSTISKVIKDRGGNNLAVSSLQPWFRAVSLVSTGLIVESLTSDDNMTTRYGSNGTSGRLGKRADNKTSIYATNEIRSNRPSPTIESVSVKNGSEGLTRTCEFTITCYTRSQAEAMIQHFLEPGYYALIEWGFNFSKSHQQKAGGGGEITPCHLIQYQNLGVLKDKRAGSDGTYDAFLGIVTGGQLGYGSDETYEVQVQLTSGGELPSYLSSHKGMPINTQQAASGIKFTPKQIEDASEDTDNIGKSLFMQMYNKLPLSKQIGNVKNLSEKSYWTDPSNFLNMDDYLREDYISNLSKTNVKSDEADKRELEVPSDVPLVSDDSFIRFELAYEILLTTVADENIFNPPSICPPYKTKSNQELKIQQIQTIDISETICRAHKHMFSTDKNKLYIPNKHLPDFGLADALSADPSGSLFKFRDDGTFDESKTIDGHPTTTGAQSKREGSAGTHYFPKLENTELNQYRFDDTISPAFGKAYEHGFLKDLYINFDFFIECMEKNGYVLYEVLLDMLNGMSSAVNLYWDFQIVSCGNPENGGEHMRVVDKTFLGLSQGATKKNDSGIPSVVKTAFQSIGVTSPFLEADFTMDIPGETANMVMAQRGDKTAKNADGAVGSPSDSPGSSIEKSSYNFETGLFQSLPDPVGERLNKINREITVKDKQVAAARKQAEVKQAEVDRKKQGWGDSVKSGVINAWNNAPEIAENLYQQASDTIGETTGAWNSKEENETREANYDFFMKRAGVFPRGIDRNDVMRADTGFFANASAFLSSDYQTGISKVLWVGTYDDVVLLKQFETSDFKNTKSKGGGDHALNPVLLPIKFNFTIHGVSGLKVGDIFTVTDLPSKYANRVFQITQVEHEIADIWTTKVESQMRNI